MRKQSAYPIKARLYPILLDHRNSTIQLAYEKDSQPFILSKSCVMALEQIKQKLASTLNMGFPNFEASLYMHTDACKDDFAAILTQERDNARLVIWISLKLNFLKKNRERNKYYKVDRIQNI